MNNKSELIKSVIYLSIISVVGIVLSKLAITFGKPYVITQMEEGNLTFLYVAMLTFLGWFIFSIWQIGLSKLTKFSYVRYIYADSLVPIWSTICFTKFYKDFAEAIVEDDDSSPITKVFIGTVLPTLFIINTIAFWVITVVGYIWVAKSVGLHIFNSTHTLYILLSISTFLIGVTLRSIMCNIILYSMSGALVVFNIKLAIIVNLLTPIFCTINTVLILLGVAGILPPLSIPILNIAYILLPTVQPILHTFQFIISSNEAELNLAKEEY